MRRLFAILLGTTILLGCEVPDNWDELKAAAPRLNAPWQAAPPMAGDPTVPIARVGGMAAPESMAAAGPVRTDAIRINPDATSAQLNKLLPPECPLSVLWALPIEGRTVRDVWVAHPRFRYDFILLLTTDNDLIAVEIATGKPIWWKELGGEPLGPPAFTRHAVYLIVNGRIVSLEKDSGEVIWRLRPGVPPAGPLFADEAKQGFPIFFMPTLERRLFCFGISVSKWPPKYGHGKLSSSDLEMDVYSLRTIWRYTTNGFMEGALAYRDPYLYAADDANRIYCIDADDVGLGKPAGKWQKLTRGSNSGGVLVAGAFIYVGSADRSIHCYSRVEGLGSWKCETGRIIRETPIYVGDKNTGEALIMARGEDVGPLFAIDAAKGDKLWTREGRAAVVAMDDEPEKAFEDRASVVVFHEDGSVEGVLFRTGEELWRIPAGVFTQAATTPQSYKSYLITKAGAVVCLGRR